MNESLALLGVLVIAGLATYLFPPDIGSNIASHALVGLLAYLKGQTSK